MLTKTAFGVALVLATASGALATTKTQAAAPSQNVYNPFGADIGADPDSGTRFELDRDFDRARNK
jgi:hypothetical protein